MRVTPIAEVQDLEPDQTITCIRGQLTKLYKRKTGTNSNGEWSIQGGEISAGKDRIELFIKDHEEVSQAWKGREIIITAFKGDKGWSGVYAYDDEYGGKTTRKVKVTKTAEIALYDESGEAPEEPPQRPQNQQKAQPREQAAERPPAAQKPPQAPAPPANPQSGIKKAKALALQIGNAQILAAAVVDTQVIPQIKARTGVETTVELRTSLIMNMVIQLQHAYAHLDLPAHTLKAEDTKPAPQAQPKANSPAGGPGQTTHQKPSTRPPEIPNHAEWDENTGSWYDPETGNYFF